MDTSKLKMGELIYLVNVWEFTNSYTVNFEFSMESRQEPKIQFGAFTVFYRGFNDNCITKDLVNHGGIYEFVEISNDRYLNPRIKPVDWDNIPDDRKDYSNGYYFAHYYWIHPDEFNLSELFEISTPTDVYYPSLYGLIPGSSFRTFLQA